MAAMEEEDIKKAMEQRQSVLQAMNAKFPLFNQKTADQVARMAGMEEEEVRQAMKH